MREKHPLAVEKEAWGLDLEQQIFGLITDHSIFWPPSQTNRTSPGTWKVIWDRSSLDLRLHLANVAGKWKGWNKTRAGQATEDQKLLRPQLDLPPPQHSGLSCCTWRADCVPSKQTQNFGRRREDRLCVWHLWCLALKHSRTLQSVFPRCTTFSAKMWTISSSLSCCCCLHSPWAKSKERITDLCGCIHVNIYICS